MPLNSITMQYNISAAIFIHSFILETYIVPLQETTTQGCSQPSHRQKRRTSERCKIWKGGPSAGNAAQRGVHSILMDPQPNIYVCACVCVCVCIYIYIYIYTHTHTVVCRSLHVI